VEHLRAGLCDDCLHRHIVDSGRSKFLLCRRGLTDPAYPKYPPLPVLACPGYAKEPGRQDSRETTDRDDKLS
jgi:hypothetical protein